MANNQLPQPVLPRAGIMSQNPISALAEIRTSLSATLANFEASLPTGAPGLGTMKLPKIEQIFKGPTEFMRSILPQAGGTRGTITVEATGVTPLGGVPTRGSL